MSDTERLRDSAFAANIPATWKRAVGGYYGGPRAFHVWAPADWDRFKGQRKLPIWVGGFDGPGEGEEAVRALRALKVPKGAFTVLDLEDRVDKTYVHHFGQVLQDAGYKVFPYGQASTVFGNPQLNGYWVAEYAGRGPFMHDHENTRITQYASPETGSGGQWDSSTVKDWTYYRGSWWR